MPMLHDQSQSESHLEHAHLERPSQPYLVPASDVDLQRKRMLIALGILLLALGAVILKDWDFWFPPSGGFARSVGLRKAKPEAAVETPSVAGTGNHERKPAKPAVAAPAETPTPLVARTVLPPLEVEVVSGNQRVSIPARSNAIRVDAGSGASISNGASVARPSSAPAMAASTGHVQLSPQVAQRLAVSVPPDYPLLARQMKVQGAVSLQALIARDGTIQELEIMSGPDILAAAAREAVKQWHFKPYLQNGQPVETQARITVNFTISTN